MWKFIKHEWKFWTGSPMMWIFFLINTLLVMGAVSSDNVSIGGGVGSVHKNAPYVIQTYYGVLSLICLLMTTAFTNASANRDFSSGMFQFIFSSPISKGDYYFGKFIGATSIAIIPLLGVSLGSLIGAIAPWAQPERYGPIIWEGHLLGLITYGIPNTIISACILYVLAVLFRSNIVSFVGSMLILIFYVVASGFMSDVEKEWLAVLFDPFGLRPASILSKYMTIEEKNMGGIPFQGIFLNNRLLWMGIGLIILYIGYLRFSFSTKNSNAKKEKKTKELVPVLASTDTIYSPTAASKLTLATLVHLIWFETKAIIKNPTFIIIVIIGLMNLVASLTSFSGRYGTDQYPVTYDVIDAIRGSFYLFLIGIITFYSGVLVWKERDAKINELEDATPIRTSLLFSSKLVAMVLAIALVLASTIFIGIITQSFFGYTRYQLDVYLKSLLVIDLFSFTFLVVLALFFHYLINNRYIAYFAFVAFVILNSFIWGLLEINTLMVRIGEVPSLTYSDMNGFGPFIPSVAWYTVYWSAFSLILCFIVYAFYLRGKETGIKLRLKNAALVLGKNKLALGLSILIFIGCGGFVFYNTEVLNTYRSTKQQETDQVDYEKTYKKYENLVQPRFYKYVYNIDIMPEERSLKAKIEAWASNISSDTITQLHFTMPQIPDSLLISIEGAKFTMNDERLGYRIYTLAKPMLPNDSIKIQFELYRITKGFENQVSFKQLTQNGTFFNNRDIIPVLGYEPGLEISDKNKRSKLKLPKRLRMAKLNEQDMKKRANNYISRDADWIDLTTTISTSADQIAIAPGSLQKSWEENGRKYFTYKLDHQSLDFYSFISARYEVARKKWKGIDIEVYYHKDHSANVPNMLKSLEKSLDYYTLNFGPYYHKQCRIIEFPRYASFAQSFPGTMPYSEGIGFIVDLRKVTKEDVDLVYYVVAHEMAHQYWAHQLTGADMQGSEWMSEGFSQYSALMVMEKEYGRDKMKKFLKYEMDDYLRGRGMEFEGEQPLYKTEQQGYIHYQKASVLMYYLKEMIGEQKVNEAMRSLIDTFAYKKPPYATSMSALRAFRKVTPDSLQYLISDMFENITIFSNRALDANYKKVDNGYEVSFKTISEKFKADSLGKESVLPMADYIDIGVFAEPENKKNLGKALIMKRIKIDKKENSFTFITKEKPYQVGIDPYNYLIDRIPSDNLKKADEESKASSLKI